MWYRYFAPSEYLGALIIVCLFLYALIRGMDETIKTLITMTVVAVIAKLSVKRAKKEGDENEDQ